MLLGDGLSIHTAYHCSLLPCAMLVREGLSIHTAYHCILSPCAMLVIEGLSIHTAYHCSLLQCAMLVREGQSTHSAYHCFLLPCAMFNDVGERRTVNPLGLSLFPTALCNVQWCWWEKDSQPTLPITVPYYPMQWMLLRKRLSTHTSAEWYNHNI